MSIETKSIASIEEQERRSDFLNNYINNPIPQNE